MDPKVIDTLRHVAVLAVILVLGILGFRLYKSSQNKKQLVADMKADVTDTAFYHSVRDSDAKATLLRCVGRLQRAQQLGLTADQLFDDVFDHKKSLSNDRSLDENSDGLPVKEKLVRATIKNAYQRLSQLGVFEDGPAAMESLKAGEMPSVSPKPVIEYIVDPALSPGLELVVANLQVLAEAKKKDAVPTDMEIAATRQLVFDLTDASVIDRNAQKRIIDEYDSARAKANTPAPATVPSP